MRLHFNPVNVWSSDPGSVGSAFSLCEIIKRRDGLNPNFCNMKKTNRSAWRDKELLCLLMRAAKTLPVSGSLIEDFYFEGLCAVFMCASWINRSDHVSLRKFVPKEIARPHLCFTCPPCRPMITEMSTERWQIQSGSHFWKAPGTLSWLF